MSTARQSASVAAWPTDEPTVTQPSLGVVLQGPIASLADSAERCEAAGAAAIWVGEYFQSPFARAAVALAATRRASVGTHVAQAFARSPPATALAASELHELGAGRFVLGLGGQLREANRRWHAFPTEHPVADLEEYVGAVRAILSAEAGQSVRLEGPRWPLELPGFGSCRSVQLPIGIGCARPRSTDLAVRIGDLVLGHLLWTPAIVKAVAASVARRASEPRVTVARMVAPTSVPGARADAARALAHYALTGGYSSLLRSASIELPRAELSRALQSRDDAIIERVAQPLLDRFCIQRLDDLRRQRSELGAAGADHIVLVAPARQADPTATARYEMALAAIVAGCPPGPTFTP